MGSDNFLYGAMETTSSFTRTIFTYEIDSDRSHYFNFGSSSDIRALTWLKDRDVYALFHPGSHGNNLIMARANFTGLTYSWYKLLDCTVPP